MDFLKLLYHSIGLYHIQEFLAASFVFGPTRDQKIGQRVLTGIILAFSLSISQRLFESMALVSFLSPLTSVMIPIIIVLGLTAFAWKFKSF